MNEGVPEMSNNVEQLSDWREQKEHAVREAKEILERDGFEVQIGHDTPEEVRRVVEGLPQLINDLSFVDGDPEQVRNENRFVVRTLTNFHEYAKSITPANDNVNPFREMTQNS